MVPMHSRQILSITLPTIAIFLSYLWFRRKRIGGQSDPGESTPPAPRRSEKSLALELEEAVKKEVSTTPVGSPERSFNRSLSGVETTPIDIIIPRQLRSQKTSPIIISDEDLDLQIEKVKSMKSTVEPYSISKVTDTVDSPRKYSTPIKNQSPMKSAKKQAGASAPKPKQEIPNKSNSKAPNKSSPKKPNKKEGAKLENKFSEMKLEKKEAKSSTNVPVEREERRSCERDSANHSPVDTMLASSSLSSISDNHSEGSSDSGKGGSDVATPPSRTPANDVANLPTIHEFLIPQQLVGKLIGRYGCFVAEIKEKTRAQIIIRKHPTTNKSKICTIEGTQSEIDKALRMIRERFPIKRYSEMTLEHVSFNSEPVQLTSPEHLYLKLVEGVNNDTTISCVITPDHLFVQQPTHPSFPSLQVLTRCMNMCYNSNTLEIPTLPTPIPENTICVALSNGQWYRAMVLSSDEENETSYVTFLDCGGYAYIKNMHLKQIRGDMLLLPFQSAECILANIRPVGGEWCEEAYRLVSDMGKCSLVLTQIAEYTEQGVPLVLMYILVGHQSVVFLNEELVKRGYAEFITSPESEELEGAVGGVLA